jgi:3-isopropylmalate dehydratase small subunit
VISAVIKAGLDAVLVGYNFTMGSSPDMAIEALAKAGVAWWR